MRGRDGEWKELTEDFNALRGEAGAADAVSALELEKLDRPPSGGESAVVRVPPGESNFLKYSVKLYDLYLREHADGTQPTQDPAGWESDLSELLNQVAESDPSKEQCPECGYWQKLSWLQGTFDMTPDGQWKEKVLAEMVRDLATSPLQNTQRNLWLNQMKALLNLTRTPTREQQVQLDEFDSKHRDSPLPYRPGKMSGAIREAMKRSGNNTIYVYVEAEELFRFPYFSPYLSCKVDCH